MEKPNTVIVLITYLLIKSVFMDSKEVIELNQKMFELSKGLEKPKNIGVIK